MNSYPVGGNGGIMSDLLTSVFEGLRRLRVDVGRTGFWEAREFRISFPLDIGASPTVLKFVSPVDFILQHQEFSVDAESYKFEAFRDGTEGGTFTEVPIYGNNIQLSAPDYTRQAETYTGGTFTPSSPAVETVRMRSAGSTAQAATVGGAVTGERGLAAGTYYLVFTRLGTQNALGVYTLIWEERP
jgi:hypothetical protein